MASQFDFEGVYDKTKRYIVNNWSDEDFVQSFGSEVAYNGDKMIEVTPARELGQFEAYTITKHFVNREMLKDAAKLKERQLVERAEMGINNAELRKPYENKTISEIEAGKATPFMEKMREEIRQEELAKINKGLDSKKEELLDPISPVIDQKEAGEFEETK